MLEASPLWPKVLEAIKPSVTRATFDAWLRDTTATQRNGTLTVTTPRPLALDWLEHRLRPQIERAVTEAAGHNLEIKFEIADATKVEQEQLFFTGSYRDAYNEIVRPDALVCTTRYFHDNWRPLLGNDLWLLIWEMRRHCFWNKTNPEKSRDTFEATREELAASIGVSEATIKRLLNPSDPEKKAILDKFITCLGVKRGYSNKVGRVVYETTTWRVRLDDPLTPADEQRLSRMVSTGQNDL